MITNLLELFLKEKKAQVFVIILFALIPYLNIFQNGFVIDDKIFTIWADSKSINEIPNILKGEVPLGHEGVFRPIRGVFYFFYANGLGGSIFLYHLHSILINILCSILIYLITSKIFKNTMSAGRQNLLGFLAAIIFASHPVHTEAITYIASSMDSTGIMFMLLSFYLYILCHSRRSGNLFKNGFRIKSGMTMYIGSIIFAYLAFFTYEMTLTLPFLIIFHDFCFKNLTIKNWKQRIRLYIPYIVSLAFYFTARVFLIGLSGRAFYPGDSMYTGFLVMLKVFAEYLKLIIAPFNLAHNHILGKGIESFIYRGYNIEKFKELSITNLDILSYIFIYIGLFIICWKTFRKYKVVSFCLGGFLILLLPASGIIPQGSVMNERLIYGASFPIILLFIWILNKVIKNQINLLVTCLIISLLFGFLTYKRNLDWRDEAVFWTKEVSIAPNTNAYAYFQLGNTLRNSGEYAKAGEHFKKANEINPNFLVAKASEAQIYDITGKEDKALQLYEESIKKEPYFWEAYRELGKIYLKEKKFDLAKAEFEKLLQIYPNNPEALDLLFITAKLKEENNHE